MIHAGGGGHGIQRVRVGEKRSLMTSAANEATCWNASTEVGSNRESSGLNYNSRAAKSRNDLWNVINYCAERGKRFVRVLSSLLGPVVYGEKSRISLPGEKKPVFCPRFKSYGSCSS